MVAIFVLGAIVFFYGKMLGFTHESLKGPTEANSADPARAVDEKTLQDRDGNSRDATGTPGEARNVGQA